MREIHPREVWKDAADQVLSVLTKSLHWPRSRKWFCPECRKLPQLYKEKKTELINIGTVFPRLDARVTIYCSIGGTTIREGLLFERIERRRS